MILPHTHSGLGLPCLCCPHVDLFFIFQNIIYFTSYLFWNSKCRYGIWMILCRPFSTNKMSRTDVCVFRHRGNVEVLSPTRPNPSSTFLKFSLRFRESYEKYVLHVRLVLVSGVAITFPVTAMLRRHHFCDFVKKKICKTTFSRGLLIHHA